MRTMITRIDPILKVILIGCAALIIVAVGNCVATSVPVITITGNDDNYVWGTVENVVFPLHYEILLYVKNADGKWYGPKNSVNDTFPGITPDMKWKCLYNSDYQGTYSKYFRAYLIEKGVTTDEVLINGAQNLTLYYTQIIAQD